MLGASSTRPIACVMGDLDLVRPLGLAGIPCVVVAPPSSLARYSRFTRAMLEWEDFWEDPDALVAALLEFGAAQPEPPVLTGVLAGTVLTTAPTTNVIWVSAAMLVSNIVRDGGMRLLQDRRISAILASPPMHPIPARPTTE